MYYKRNKNNYIFSTQKLIKIQNKIYHKMLKKAQLFNKIIIIKSEKHTHNVDNSKDLTILKTIIYLLFNVLRLKHTMIFLFINV